MRMDWNQYKSAMDAQSFDPDFQARTEALLRDRRQEILEKEH